MQSVMFQDEVMNTKVLFFTFFLLIAYSFSSYFIPEYIGSEVFQLNEVEKSSDDYSSDLEETIKQSETPITKEMELLLVSTMNIFEKQRINDTRSIIDLIQYHSLILPWLLLFHFSALISVLRSRNET
jgi:hypothetical protein